VAATGLVAVSADLKRCFWFDVVKAKSNSTALLDGLGEGRITRSGEVLEKPAGPLQTSIAHEKRLRAGPKKLPMHKTVINP